jgi:hypothetical protein
MMKRTTMTKGTLILATLLITFATSNAGEIVDVYELPENRIRIG